MQELETMLSRATREVTFRLTDELMRRMDSHVTGFAVRPVSVETEITARGIRAGWDEDADATPSA